MSEKKPEYTLEFVLRYDRGRSITFTGSSDDPLLAYLASEEILHLNCSMVSNRVYDGRPVSVKLYHGEPLNERELSEEIERYYESERAKNK